MLIIHHFAALVNVFSAFCSFYNIFDVQYISFCHRACNSHEKGGKCQSDNELNTLWNADNRAEVNESNGRAGGEDRNKGANYPAHLRAYSRDMNQTSKAQGAVEYFKNIYCGNVSHKSEAGHKDENEDQAHKGVGNIYRHGIKLLAQALQHKVNGGVKIHNWNQGGDEGDVFSRFG